MLVPFALQPSQMGGAIGGGTVGSVLYVGTGSVLAQDNANFFWDLTNHRLGIGINSSLTAKLQVSAATATELGAIFRTTDGSITNALTEWQNSGGARLFRIAGNGVLSWGSIGEGSVTFDGVNSYMDSVNATIFRPSSTEVLRLTSSAVRMSANVGINQTTPTSWLHVVATSTFGAAGVSSINSAAHTVTLSGGNPTTYATFYTDQIGQMTLTGTSAGQTVTAAAALSILGAPIKSTNVALTNTYGLKIEAGAVSTATNSFGAYIDAQTGAGSNYGLIVNTGNVGIGIASPGNTFQIGSIGATGYTGNEFAVGDGTRAYAIDITSAGANIYSNLDMIFYANTTEVMRIEHTKNGLGIGITSLLAKLHVATATATLIGFIIKTTDSNTTKNLMECHNSSVAVVQSINATGNISEAMGATTTLMTEVGIANVQTSATGVGNTADTNDDTLFTYSLPLNTMSANGKSIRVRASGTTAANANTKDIKLWFAGTTIIDSGVIALNNADWSIEMEITRIDSTHVSCVGTWTDNGLASATVKVTANLVVSDLSANASVIKVTGASTVVGAANDVKGYLMKTWFEN